MRNSRRPWIGLLSLLGVLVVMSACDSGGANETGTVTGQWQGTVETDSVTYEIRFDLEEADASDPTGPRLTGTGELMGAERRSFQITDGSFTEPNRALSLNFRFDVPRPILLQGTVAEDYESISAELSGGPPRFDETPVTLTRP